MNAHGASTTGAKGCQISAVMQRNACPRRARFLRSTGPREIALCARCNMRHGAAIGPLVTTETVVIVGTLSPAECVITEPKRP